MQIKNDKLNMIAQKTVTFKYIYDSMFNHC